MIMKKTVITDDLIVFSDGFVWKRLSRKAAEALWNSVISHENCIGCGLMMNPKLQLKSLMTWKGRLNVVIMYV